MDAIWPLVVGFLLTSVLEWPARDRPPAQVLGARQNEVQLREAELDKAVQVCQAVSGLLDKRRYRMLRLFHAVRGRAQGTVSADGLADKLADYDRVLYEWNDALNVNLAMVATSFGREVWEELERVYATYEGGPRARGRLSPGRAGLHAGDAGRARGAAGRPRPARLPVRHHDAGPAAQRDGRSPSP